MKKVIYGGAIAIAIMFAGCSESMTEKMTGATGNEATESVDQAALEKNGNSRSVYNWEKMGEVKNVRDIAAYDNVYAISADGRTIYEWTGKTNSFSAMTISANIFKDDPAVSIDAGGGSLFMSAPHFMIYDKGVWVTTASKKVYRLLSQEYNDGPLAGQIKPVWYEVKNANADGICVNSDSENFIFTDKGSLDEVSEYGLDNNNSSEWQKITRDIGGDIVACDGGKEYAPHPYGAVYGAYFLTKDNSVSVLKQTVSSRGYFYEDVDTRNTIPTKDITASHIENGAIATFHNNSNYVH